MAVARKMGVGLRALGAKIPKLLNVGARLKVADNSGAKVIEIIAVKRYKGVKARMPRAGLGDIIIGAVKVGTPEMKHKVVPCVVIRQRKEFRRPNGIRIGFEDNACIVLKDIEKYETQGTIIKGPVPKEVTKRFPNIGKISSIIV